MSTLGTSDDTNVCHAAQEYLGEFFVGSPQAAPHEPMMKDSRDRSNSSLSVGAVITHTNSDRCRVTGHEGARTLIRGAE